ncbi:hypothetical protein PISMIDRAFT_672429, partial [Pisolithus microcarpus 441]
MSHRRRYTNRSFLDSTVPVKKRLPKFLIPTDETQHSLCCTDIKWRLAQLTRVL